MRIFKVVIVCLGWIVGIALSLIDIFLFLFGVRAIFVEGFGFGLQVIAGALILGWLLGLYKKVLVRFWLHSVSAPPQP